VPYVEAARQANASRTHARVQGRNREAGAGWGTEREELARDLGLADSLVRAWVRQADVDAGKGAPGALTTAEKEELSQLRREVKVLRMEREILKRAATFFAKESA
jgi:transposase